MMLIADRTNDGALVESAVTQIEAAHETLAIAASCDGSHTFSAN